jgi:GNAT superfamily N-acetyltransferase
MIVRAERKHLEAILRMGEQFYKASGFRHIAGFDPTVVTVIAEKMIEDQASDIFLAFDGDDPVGMAGVTIAPIYFSPGQVMAQELFWWVDPSHRGKGVGRALLDDLETWGKMQGAVVLNMVALQNDRKRVTSMYRTAGYRQLETTYSKRL